jgi:hypothetical protein
LQPENELKTNTKEDLTHEQDVIKYPFQPPSNRSSIPMIAGIILLIAGVFSIFFWIQIFTLDVTTLESVIDISQFKQIDPSITPEKIIAFLDTCAIIGCIIAVFPILGALFALKRKLWGIALTCSIIGLFSLGILFTSSGLSFIAMILLIISRKEFQ